MRCLVVIADNWINVSNGKLESYRQSSALDELIQAGCLQQIHLESSGLPPLLQLVGADRVSDNLYRPICRYPTLKIRIWTHNQEIYDQVQQTKLDQVHICALPDMCQPLDADELWQQDVQMALLHVPPHFDFDPLLLHHASPDIIRVFVGLPDEAARSFDIKGPAIDGFDWPLQSFRFKNGEQVDVEPFPLIAAYHHPLLSRRDRHSTFDVHGELKCGRKGILAWHFLPELAYYLGRASKYGA